MDDIKGKMKYVDNSGIIKTSIHLGQRKLFLCELQFLTNVLQRKTDKCYVVYAGAAPSNHTYLLKDFFPNIKFILVDPRSFKLFINKVGIAHYFKLVEDIVYLKHNGKTSTRNVNMYEEDDWVNYIKRSNKRFYLIEDFFTNEYAKLFSNLDDRPIYFWSDIRSSSGKRGYPSDLDVLWNLAQQYNWINFLKPIKSMLKFRCPFFMDVDYNDFKERHNNEPYKSVFRIAKEYGIDFISNYLDKKLLYYKCPLLLQVFGPITTAEVRLIIDDNCKLDFMGCSYLEEQMMYYNNITRIFSVHKNPYSDRELGFDKCADCSLETLIWMQYINKMDKKINVLNCVRKLSKVLGTKFKSKLHGTLFEPFTDEWYRDIYEKNNAKNLKVE